MRPETWIAVGAMAASAIAVAINLLKAWRDKRDRDMADHSDYLRAVNEMKMDSIAAAERVIELYSNAMVEMQAELDRLRTKVDGQQQQIAELRSTVHSLEAENLALRRTHGV